MMHLRQVLLRGANGSGIGHELGITIAIYAGASHGVTQKYG